jgi:hypothetical protein
LTDTYLLQGEEQKWRSPPPRKIGKDWIELAGGAAESCQRHSPHQPSRRYIEKLNSIFINSYIYAFVVRQGILGYHLYCLKWVNASTKLRRPQSDKTAYIYYARAAI